MSRHQRGYLYEASNAFHVRYYAEVDGVRKQLSHRLCTKDRKTGHGTLSARAVQILCEDHMREVNTQAGKPEEKDRTIVEFWERTYLPFIKDDNLKPSTIYGYEQIWDTHLKPHFGTTMTLRAYRKGMGSTFLTKLSKTHRPNTVTHIKNLASAIFTHAANLDEVESNPWQFCHALGKSKLTNGVTQHYTLEEIENIITALVDHVDCQLIMALAFFLGLRKGEMQGLQWGDVDADWLHIRRNIVRGVETTPKTKKSVRSLPLIQPVRGLLKLQRAKSSDGVWVFDRNLMTLARKTIQPTLKKAGLKWKGYHAGRRGLGTVLRQITGNSTAGRDVLGHEDEEVTKDHYEGALPDVAVAGMKLLEAKTLGK
jgi:integrase